MMENPNQLAKELPGWKWIWKTNKGDFLFITCFTLALMLWSYFAGGSFWIHFIFLPVWYCLHIIRWWTLYKKNVKLYYNWEETFRGVFDKHKENRNEQSK